MNAVGDFIDLGIENAKDIKSQQERDQRMAMITSVLTGVGALGSIGFGISNGLAVAKQFKGGGLVGALTGNAPALFGSGTLLANNTGAAVMNGEKAAQISTLIQQHPNLAGLGAAMTDKDSLLGGSDLGVPVARVLTSAAKADYILNDDQRLKSYMEWAEAHPKDASIYTPGATDSGYDGVMPHQWWTSGQFQTDWSGASIEIPGPGDYLTPAMLAAKHQAGPPKFD